MLCIRVTGAQAKSSGSETKIFISKNSRHQKQIILTLKQLQSPLKGKYGRASYPGSFSHILKWISYVAA